MDVLNPHALAYPFTAEQVAALKLGEAVSITGRVFTGRDRLHKYLFEGGASPVDLKNGAIYHCGPVIVRREGGWAVRAAGPTTSLREEPYLPKIIQDHGVRVIIGKGSLGPRTEAACAQFGCVFLQAVGGAAQVLAEKIQRVSEVYLLKELGFTEAMWELEVKDFPALVAIDARGHSLYRRIQSTSQRKLRRLLKEEDPFVA